MLNGGIHGSDGRGYGYTMKKRRRKYIEIDEENEKESMDENLEEDRHNVESCPKTVTMQEPPGTARR